MLHLIYSQNARATKAHIIKCIKNCVSSGVESVALIVPEQYSFTSERDLLISLGNQKAACVDVFSFTRLAQKLIRDGVSKEDLTPSCACVLMSIALKNVKDSLVYYKKHYGKKSTINEFLRLSTEFKQNSVSNDKIAELASAENSLSPLLKEKLSDISMTLKEYDKLVGERFFNTDDLLTQLCESAAVSAYFGGKTVFIDSFRGFTSREYEVIEKMLACAKDVYVTVLADRYEKGETPDITELFARSKDTAGRLVSIADKLQIPSVSEPIEHNDGIAISEKPEDLAFLSDNLYRGGGAVFEGASENIILRRAKNIYSECEFTAAYIKKLVREKGLRYRDFAIIARNIDEYEQPLKSALKKCDIDIFEDRRKSVDASPVMGFISAALSAVKNNFDNDSMMRYIKTGLTGLSEAEVSLLDNYCFVWNIKSAQWLKEWTGNPDGVGETNDESQIELEKINKLRVKTVMPLKSLKDRLYRGVDGGEALTALWDFIEEVSLCSHVIKLAEKLNDDGETGAVNELRRMWKLLVDIIEVLASLIKDEQKVTAGALSDYFELMLSVQTVGNIPHGVDEVVIGSADRIRVASPKVTFILGANEGVFPAVPDFSSALTIRDREEIRKLGVELSLCAEMKLAEEKLIAYTSVCSAVEKLVVSSTMSDSSGSDTYTSDFYDEIKEMFPGITEIYDPDIEDLFFAEGKQLAFEHLAKSTDKVFEATAAEYFKGDPLYAGKIAALSKAGSARDFSLNPDIATGLFGETMNLSASRIGSYYGCPFSYFCQYGLKAQALKQANLDPIQRGNIVHLVFENILKNHSVEDICNMSDEELSAEIEKHSSEYISENLDESILTGRVNYQIGSINGDLLNSVRFMSSQLRDSGYRPVAFELEIGDGKAVESYIPANGEGKIKIKGKIDRVDIADDGNGNRYLRIIDYKSGTKEFNIVDAWNGTQLQMPIYLFSLMKNGTKLFGDFKPGGFYYYTPSIKAQKVAFGANPDKVKDSLSTTSDGFTLDDDNLKAMTEKLGKAKSLMKPEQFYALNKRTDSLISGMQKSLCEGKIEPYPLSNDPDDTPHTCKNCDFAPICGLSDSTPVNFVSNKAPDKTRILGEEMDKIINGEVN